MLQPSEHHAAPPALCPDAPGSGARAAVVRSPLVDHVGAVRGTPGAQREGRLEERSAGKATSPMAWLPRRRSAHTRALGRVARVPIWQVGVAVLP